MVSRWQAMYVAFEFYDIDLGSVIGQIILVHP